MILRLTSVFLVLFLSLSASFAQTDEQVEEARVFFVTYDEDGDTLLSVEEFVVGFIAKSRLDRPVQTRLAMFLFGKRRIEDCLVLGFEQADLSADGLLALEEMAEAYAQDAFEDLGKMC